MSWSGFLVWLLENSELVHNFSYGGLPPAEWQRWYARAKRLQAHYTAYIAEHDQLLSEGVLFDFVGDPLSQPEAIRADYFVGREALFDSVYGYGALPAPTDSVDLFISTFDAMGEFIPALEFEPTLAVWWAWPVFSGVYTPNEVFERARIATWALTGFWQIGTARGQRLSFDLDNRGRPV